MKLTSTNPVNKLTEFGLSGRQYEVLSYILMGMTYKEIGVKLGIENKTASKYAWEGFRKLGCKSKQEFLEKYERSGD